MDGKQVNGFVTKDGITLNIDSAKAMNATVGHEITHVLEGTEFYDSLKQTIFDYAKAKGEYQSRYDSLSELYKDIKDTDIEAELTADLVGDYLFSDPDFINNLSTQNRNVFQKIFDEIKYLCKVVTAGSKEARELEKVKRAFEEAYRESGTQKNTAEASGVQYSLYWKPNFTKDEWSIVNRRKFTEFDNPAFDIDTDKKWMYANEKGSTVFAVYSKHDADDPTILYGSHGKQAERDYAKVSKLSEGGSNHANRGRTTIDRLLADIERQKGNDGNGISYDARGRSADGDVSLPIEESASNGRRNYDDGREPRRNSALTEYYTEEASDEPDASSVTFSNDYATIRNFMKEGDTKTDTVDGNQEIDNIAPVRSLSNEGQQHTPDSLSALRLEAPVYSEAELPHGAPIAEKYTGGIAPTVSKKVADRYPGEHPVAYKAELPYGAPVADDFTERSEASQPVSQMTEDDFAPMVDSIGKNGVPGGQKAADAGAGKAVTRKEYHRRIIEDIKSKFKLRGFDFDEVLKNSKNLSTFCFPAYRCGGKRKTSA